MPVTPERYDDAVIVQLQVRLPKAMHEKLRRRAFKENRPLATIAREFIGQGLKRKAEPAP